MIDRQLSPPLQNAAYFLCTCAINQSLRRDPEGSPNLENDVLGRLDDSPIVLTWVGIINFENDELVIIPGYELEPPERKTQATRQALRQYEVIDEEGELITSGTYWVELDLAEL